MGDETDVFDLPYHEGSGNADVGHMTQDRQLLVRNSQRHLTETINEFYDGGMSFVQLEHNLEQLGYSHDRVTEIATATHMEYRYRQTHNGQPSDLSVNQLNYLQRGAGFDIGRTNVHTDLSGRTYVDDYRVRDDAGNPSRLFLPAPVRLDPLTGEQREEFDYLSQVQQDITITPASLTGERNDFSQEQRENIMRLATAYLNSDPDMRTAERMQFRNNVQNIDGIENIDNIEEDLFELFVDIDDEYEYRQNNDGLPRNMTQEQLDFLRDNPELRYSGQPILQDPDSELFYYFTADRGKVPLISPEQIQTLQERNPRYSELDIPPTNDDWTALNQILTRYITGEYNEGEALNDIMDLTQYNPNDRTSDPYRATLYNQFSNTLLRTQDEREFRRLNNGRPSQLSELQYEYLLNHTIRDEREERYNGQMIIVDNEGGLSYRMSSGINLSVPSDAYIEGFIQQGFYTRPIAIQPSVRTDDETIDYRVNRVIATIGQDRYNGLSQEQRDLLISAVEDKGDLERVYNSLGLDQIPVASQVIFLDEAERQNNPLHEPGLSIEELRERRNRQRARHDRIVSENREGNFIEHQLNRHNNIEGPPIVRGQTEPIDPQTGESLSVPTPQEQVTRYEQFFNQNQSLYEPFRNMFRDLLPVFSGALGGYFAFSLTRIRERNTIQQIVNNERELIDTLSFRINNLITQQDASIENLDNLRGQADAQVRSGYDILQQLNIRRGQLAGMEDDPDIDVNLQQLVRTESQRLTQSNQDLRIIREQLVEAEDITNQIGQQITDASVSRRNINNQLNNLLELDYNIISQIQQSAPQILTGIQIGTTLGLVLSGYLFPTYVAIEDEPFITAKNIEYNKDKQEIKHPKISTDKYPKKQVISKFKMIEPREHKKTIIKPPTQTFTPVKDNRGKPLSYLEIQQLKSTLSKSELNNLKGKYLLFNDDNKPMITKEDKCMSIVGETQIFKRPVKIR
jgi:hypothetical protein